MKATRDDTLVEGWLKAGFVICHDHLFNGEEIETHHIVPVVEGGSDGAT